MGQGTRVSTFIHVIQEVKASGPPKFLETMGEATTLLEGWGWKQHGAFVQRTGRLNTVIDVWELQNFYQFDEVLKKFVAHPRFPAIKAVLDEAVTSETIVFADKVSYMR
jgi:hypothetical protein